MKENNIELKIKRLIDVAARLGITVEFYDPSYVSQDYALDPFEETIQINVKTSEKDIEKILRREITNYVNNLIRESEEKPGMKYKDYIKYHLYTSSLNANIDLNLKRIKEEYRTI